MPHEHIAKAIKKWTVSPERLIGYKGTSRSHALENGTYVYKKYSPNGASIVLPPGMVFHRKYLDLYSSDRFANLRKIVDDTMNCDDILFNFIVSEATHLPPVIVQQFAKPIKMPGLWKRSNHFKGKIFNI
jgi:hypothetical protein